LDGERSRRIGEKGGRREGTREFQASFIVNQCKLPFLLVSRKMEGISLLVGQFGRHSLAIGPSQRQAVRQAACRRDSIRRSV
jgi:hypothetical protein